MLGTVGEDLLCAFCRHHGEGKIRYLNAKNHSSDLTILGSKSGRDGDKIALTKLTPVKSAAVAAPSFKEADLIIECRKIYWQDLDERNFLSAKIAEKYPQMDYHRIYFGEMLRIRGSREFSRK